LYGLKQASHAWYKWFATFLCHLGFIASTSDTPLFVYKEGDQITYLLLYVKDIILTASSSTLLQHIMDKLSFEFSMMDLSDLHHFLGITITHSTDNMFLSQQQYVVDLLRRAGMVECHSTTIPVDTHAKFSVSDRAFLSTVDASVTRVLWVRFTHY
jgi:hypothetical protein